MATQKITVDGNEAVALVAHKINEVVAIYPITPSSEMAEHADAYSASGQKNIWGTVPHVMEMQSESGAAGSVHGALQTGALTTTFTASQGLLLMVSNMYKIAGELTPTVFHVAARSVATHALSIFGDHSDVMSTRSTGFAMLSSGSVQEAHDFALISTAATLEARVPFLHFFDGFRTSHEVMKIDALDEDQMRAMIDSDLVRAHRSRALTPDAPVIRGTAQNPDIFFQSREASNGVYTACPEIVQRKMDQFAELTGRAYSLFEYVGAPDAERVIVLMGSGAGTVEETVRAMNEQGEKVGVIKVRLYRPFPIQAFVDAIPGMTKVIGALDRTKEPGSTGGPLYQDIVIALRESGSNINVVGGRYGLSSKEFTPAMVKGCYDEMANASPKRHFTVGINDDVTQLHVEYDSAFDIEPDEVFRSLFYGLGSDGTVGANKNSIKIIGEATDNHAQGYFVYDSKKAGAVTTSHLRFGPSPVRSAYLISRANFVACHQPVFLERYEMLDNLVDGGTFLLNSPHDPDTVWDHLPKGYQEKLIKKKIQFYTIDAYRVAREAGLGGRINTVMQTCFFAISAILPEQEAIDLIKQAIKKTYGKGGEIVVNMNYAAVDSAQAHLHKIELPEMVTSSLVLPPTVSDEAPAVVTNILAPMMAGCGDKLPVSALPADGTYPTGTTRWEKRNIAVKVPAWDPDVCIQCNKCAIVCPHACIRPKVYDEELLANAPAQFLSTDARSRDFKGSKYTLQVAVEDCTGCSLCVHFCPAKNKQDTSKKAINMVPQAPLREQERENYSFFLELPGVDRKTLNASNVRNSQLLEPLFEYSSACAGCGETPYLKLATQLFGDRMIVANATGCSSIYGGNLPTTPWSKNADGRGPAWSNSLFEDNAEFGLGFRLTIDKQTEFATELVDRMREQIGVELADVILSADQSDEAGIHAQRERVAQVKAKLEGTSDPDGLDLLSVADNLVKKSAWVVGGDGWAYDIGFGGLDHVLASGRNVNVLVLDTEVYSNTGGQMSKSTPKGAVA